MTHSFVACTSESNRDDWFCFVRRLLAPVESGRTCVTLVRSTCRSRLQCTAWPSQAHWKREPDPILSQSPHQTRLAAGPSICSLRRSTCPEHFSCRLAYKSRPFSPESGKRPANLCLVSLVHPSTTSKAPHPISPTPTQTCHPSQSPPPTPSSSSKACTT